VITRDKGARPVEAGDILILVRRRSPLFRQIIAALKAKGLPIAGVDRSDLTAPLAVQDLLSLCGFSRRPRTDLSLAEVLRSPIGGWSEDDLFRLAHGRTGHLWEALRTGRRSARIGPRRMPCWSTCATSRISSVPMTCWNARCPARYPPPPDRASGRRGGGRHRRDAVPGAGL
jgi:ATP-dependent exoDNAse (exonuclease V) beta subunit